MVNLDQAKHTIADNPTFDEELRGKMLRLITFIEKNPQIKYFPLSKINNITKSENVESCMSIAAFFCGEKLKIFEPRYSYILESNREVELTKEEFKYFLFNREKELKKDGFIISPVLKERLSFYFTTSTDLEISSGEWDID